ncbi:MAG: hypothetical protein QG604_921 [Candidatus Dependentiae bacterium]|nr:hypothetical protein [Candidatus Dependentiae bacterium]
MKRIVLLSWFIACSIVGSLGATEIENVKANVMPPQKRFDGALQANPDYLKLWQLFRKVGSALKLREECPADVYNRCKDVIEAAKRLNKKKSDPLLDDLIVWCTAIKDESGYVPGKRLAIGLGVAATAAFLWWQYARSHAEPQTRNQLVSTIGGGNPGSGRFIPRPGGDMPGPLVRPTKPTTKPKPKPLDKPKPKPAEKPEKPLVMPTKMVVTPETVDAGMARLKKAQKSLMGQLTEEDPSLKGALGFLCPTFTSCVVRPVTECPPSTEARPDGLSADESKKWDKTRGRWQDDRPNGLSDTQWGELERWLRSPDLVACPSFLSDEEAVAHRARLQWFKEYPRNLGDEDWFEQNEQWLTDCPDSVSETDARAWGDRERRRLARAKWDEKELARGKDWEAEQPTCGFCFTTNPEVAIRLAGCDKCYTCSDCAERRIATKKVKDADGNLVDATCPHGRSVSNQEFGEAICATPEDECEFVAESLLKTEQTAAYCKRFKANLKKKGIKFKKFLSKQAGGVLSSEQQDEFLTERSKANIIVAHGALLDRGLEKPSYLGEACTFVRIPAVTLLHDVMMAIQPLSEEEYRDRWLPDFKEKINDLLFHESAPRKKNSTAYLESVLQRLGDAARGSSAEASAVLSKLKSSKIALPFIDAHKDNLMRITKGFTEGAGKIQEAQIRFQQLQASMTSGRAGVTDVIALMQLQEEIQNLSQAFLGFHSELLTFISSNKDAFFADLDTLNKGLADQPWDDEDES